ncbi:hypothetical protein NF699_08170 [Sphingomonadaceae bacterium OTU29LAMAA1]|nr:hypothetical protein NF699_08170 [Sphingomonadaceae bacterium OTU29LAMAA1]
MAQRKKQVDLRIVCDDETMPIELVLERLRRLLEVDFELHGSLSSPEDVATDGEVLKMTFRPLRLGVDEARSAQADRIAAHCNLLDALNVPNGIKAISIALHAHWSCGHRARFGEPASPSTVKRWRTERSRRGRDGRRCPPPRRRDVGPNRVVRGLRLHHAIRTNASGTGMREGYRKAIADLRTVNDGAHRFYEKPDLPLKPFSYVTFRRDCIGLRRGAVGRR